MKFWSKAKDGGPESTVTGYWLVEIKSLFSIVLLKFEGKSREAYHEHAFNCISWVLSGGLYEQFLAGGARTHWPSPLPVITRRSDYHKVDSNGTTWVLSFRGPWKNTWRETLPDGERTLASGRKVVEVKK